MKLIPIAGIGVLTAVLTMTASGQQADPPAGPAASPPTAGDKFPELLPPSSGLDTAPPAATTGSLAIQAIQGSAGGPAIGSIDAQVQFVHRGMVVNTIDATLDEHGVVVLEDIDVSLGVTPYVSLSYADVTYQKQGAPMTPTQPQQKMEVTCYETTDEVPDWTIQMRHVMVSPVPAGLQITEVMVVTNPATRTWVGLAGPDGERTTTAFKLPKGAADVTLGQGFHDWCCSRFENGTLANSLPLMPEASEMRFSYVIPAKDPTELEIFAPANVDSMMVLVPDGIETEALSGLEDSGTQSMGDRMVRMLTATNIPKESTARVTLAGFGGGGAAGGSTGGLGPAQLIAMIGGGLILLAAVVIIFFKSARPAPER